MPIRNEKRCKVGFGLVYVDSIVGKPPGCRAFFISFQFMWSYFICFGLFLANEEKRQIEAKQSDKSKRNETKNCILSALL